MLFRREKRAALLTFERILVPVGGTEADDPAVRLAASLVLASGGSLSLLHVIEVPFERQLDAEDPSAVAFADDVLGRAEALCAARKVSAATSIAQARAAGTAIVDDAVAQRADLIVMGLRYKKRFGGGWDAGRTVPYVMRNSTAPVWCLRAETEELASTP